MTNNFKALDPKVENLWSKPRFTRANLNQINYTKPIAVRYSGLTSGRSIMHEIIIADSWLLYEQMSRV